MMTHLATAHIIIAATVKAAENFALAIPFTLAALVWWARAERGRR